MSQFRRYTNLASLIHILKTGKITLLNPAAWDDTNDSYFMSEYKRIIGAKTVLALCFAEKAETYHHWRVFSHGSDGVCIEFDKTQLLWAFEDEPNIKQGYMKYRQMLDLTDVREMNAHELPFLKRYPYSDEREYRIIYSSHTDIVNYKDFEFDKDSIKRITLSPWIPRSISSSIRDILKSIDGCKDISIATSTLIDNDSWKQIASRAKLP